MNHCLCSVHIKLDEEDKKIGKENLKCVGHGGDCPCSQKKEGDDDAINESTRTLQG